jgi:hypothetical protein
MAIFAVAQDDGVVLGTVMPDGAIVAVDSDFIFMEIKPSTLPIEKAGMGVFSKIDIPAQEILCEYRGAIISADIHYDSDYTYSSKSSTNELISIIPDMDKPICAFINDCVVASTDAYTDTELDEIENNQRQMKIHPGFAHNSAALITKMGKVFIVSSQDIAKGQEIFFAYGNSYWLTRLRQGERSEVHAKIAAAQVDKLQSTPLMLVA